MTPVYPENSEVTVTVALPVYAGAPLVPSAVTRTVKDQTGVIIAASEAVAVPAELDETFDVVIPASLNEIAGRRAARVIDIVFTTDKGTFAVQSIYLIETPEQLIPLVNSFVSAAEAEMTRRDLPVLDGWDASATDARNAALITAHRSLCRLTYRYTDLASTGQASLSWGQPVGEGYTYLVDAERLTPDEWVAIPQIVREALQRAQLTEADVLLRGDPVGDKRRAGVISETTGESSMEFRQTPEIRVGISREAHEHLAPYIYRSTRIARA